MKIIQHHRRCSLAILALLLTQACGFIEAAGEITVGADQIPRIKYDLQWPGIDDLVKDTLTSFGGANLPPGFPKSLSQGTMAHVQGVMGIDGECHRSFDKPVIEGQTLLKNLHVDVVNCGDPNRCVARCKNTDGSPFRGMRMEARVQFNILDEEKMQKVQQALSKQTSPDAIVQIRLQFFQLAFYQTENAKKVDIGKRFAGYELGMSSPGGGDDTAMVKQRYLASISDKTPQRFELDPQSSFSIKLRTNVVQGVPQWIEIYQHLDVAQPDLYSVQLGGGGVSLDFQPELVISAVKVAAGQL